MRFLAAAFALLLSGCATVSVGPSYVHSSGLGYTPDYFGGRLEVVANKGFFNGKLVAAAFNSDKLETGDGYGYRLSAQGGYRFSYNVIWLLGVDFKHQETSTWVKEGFAPSTEIQLLDLYGKYVAGVSYMDEPDDRQWVIYGEYRSPWKYPVFLRYEYVDFKTLFAEGDGKRYEIGLLIPVLK